MQYNEASAISRELEELNENVRIIRNALRRTHGRFGNSIRRFLFTCCGKGKISVGGEGIAFGGYLTADRELMELLLKYYTDKRDEKLKELELVGKEVEKNEDGING